ncbi:hypothetical protein HK101_011601 [Irineochytrium annulatum]|nr:hypothetical protein HK101_011601 [Irineochytrium annulatum]
MRLLLDAIPDRPSGGNGRVVESMLGSPVLTPEMCDLIVGAGFDVTDQAIMIFARTSRHTLLNDDGAHRVLRAVLDAAMSKRNAILGQSQQSIVLPMMLQQLSSNEASEEWVLRQVEMLVEFGYPATENTVAIAKEQGFVETANFLEWSLKKSLSLGQVP